MKLVKNYIPCTKIYMLKLYAFMLVLIYILVALQSCPTHPFHNLIGPAILGPTIIFLIVSPLFGLIFTKKSFSTVKFYLPFSHINSIRINSYKEKIILSYNYPLCHWLGIKSKKEYKYTIHITNYATSLSELLQCFPQNILIIYDKD